MRRLFWVPIGFVAMAALLVWGAWTYRLGEHNRFLAGQLESQRQQSMNDMAFHVEQIQSMLGKGLVTGTSPGNMRYMSDVHHHAMSATQAFHSLPLPPQLQASTGKFLQQTGDFAASLLRNESAGREMDATTRAELVRLREQSAALSNQLQPMLAASNQKDGYRWNAPLRFGWNTLARGPGKPATGSQARSSLAPGGEWKQIGSTMEKLPTMLYDGPFSDHAANRTAAVKGTPVTQADAVKRLSTYVPNMAAYKVVSVSNLNGNLPAYTFRLAPAATATTTGQYTLTVSVTKNGGNLLQLLNSRMVGKPAMDLARARDLGERYLTGIGYKGMAATYGQVTDGVATIAYAFKQGSVIVYPDQAKLKIALDTGEVVAVDAGQYLLTHRDRTLIKPTLTEQQAAEHLNHALDVRRAQLALIPNLSGTGEILTWEFLTSYGKETYLVYINADSGAEEQILQQVETDGGTFVL